MKKEQREIIEKFGFDCSEKIREINQNKLCVVGMSGGVDSSVAAAISLAMGYRVIAVFMKNWEEESGECMAKEDFQDVVSVCEKLGIQYYSVNFAKEYRESVFKDFLNEYKRGFTPNPDILCNSQIKFNVFYQYAKSLGADYLVTGHYAQVKKIDGHTYLEKGLDKSKDQSYFLYRVPQCVWEDVLFPLGGIEKKDVREIAALLGLETSRKKDSTGICFIGERNFKNFLSGYLKEQEGFFKTLDGLVVGKHSGQCFYTIGQRKGLGLGGAGKPWYVASKDVETGDVFVVRGGDHPALLIDDLVASDMVGSKLPQGEKIPLKCKLRYRQKDQDCLFTYDGKKAYVEFLQPQRGVARGQSLVLYQGNLCLGGGIIEELGLSHYNKKKYKKEE